MSRDGWVEIAAYLRPDQAGMLHGLLRSAGVDAVVENVATAGLNLDALGGARVLVPAGDAQRASEIYAASGLLRAGAEHGEEIPEEEWSRPAPARADPRDAEETGAASPWELSTDDRLLLRVLKVIRRLLTH